MARQLHGALSRRERQIMDVVYAFSRATAKDVMENMPDPPSYSAVRAMLRILENKGFLRHEKDGLRYVFIPTLTRRKAARSALKNVVRTFFAGSAGRAIAALMDISANKLSERDLEQLARMIEEARKEGR